MKEDAFVNKIKIELYNKTKLAYKEYASGLDDKKYDLYLNIRELYTKVNQVNSFNEIISIYETFIKNITDEEQIAYFDEIFNNYIKDYNENFKTTLKTRKSKFTPKSSADPKETSTEKVEPKPKKYINKSDKRVIYMHNLNHDIISLLNSWSKNIDDENINIKLNESFEKREKCLIKLFPDGLEKSRRLESLERRWAQSKSVSDISKSNELKQKLIDAYNEIYAIISASSISLDELMNNDVMKM